MDRNFHLEKEEEFMKGRGHKEPPNRKFDQWFAAFMEPRDRSLNIADLGCGNGNTLKLLRGMGFENLTGVEYSEPMIAQSRNFAEIVKHDLEYPLPFGDGSFDLVVAKDICEHLINVEQLISESHRILKPGGVMVIGGPNLKSIYHRMRILGGNTSHISINFGVAHMRWVSHDTFEKWLGPYFSFEPVVFEWYAKIKPNLLARSCNFVCFKK